MRLFSARYPIPLGVLGRTTGIGVVGFEPQTDSTIATPPKPAISSTTVFAAAQYEEICYENHIFIYQVYIFLFAKD